MSTHSSGVCVGVKSQSKVWGGNEESVSEQKLENVFIITQECVWGEENKITKGHLKKSRRKKAGMKIKPGGMYVQNTTAHKRDDDDDDVYVSRLWSPVGCSQSCSKHRGNTPVGSSSARGCP